MEKMITIQVPNTKDNRGRITGLLSIPGVVIGAMRPASSSNYISLQEGADILGVNYFTFRKWVVADRKIPYTRPSGKSAGAIKLLRSEVEKFMEVKVEKRRGRKSNEVTVI